MPASSPNIRSFAVDGAGVMARSPESMRGLRNPLTDGRIAAVLFDLDGTLYRQRPMRALMALELATLALRSPLQAPVTWRVLSEFRRAQETLRGQVTDRGAGLEQLQLTARRTGLSVEQVETLVAEWMIERPLKYLARCRAEGLLQLLDFLARRGIRVGVFSDYPPELKLKALGVAGRFSVLVCSADPDVGLFKPHPRGFLVASARWQIDPSEILVVGDRPDADAAGARAAGMPCVIVGGRNGRRSSDFLSLDSLERLRDVLDDDHGR
jgi:HAD superfamily hydrolase (TIGR01549 family)